MYCIFMRYIDVLSPFACIITCTCVLCCLSLNFVYDALVRIFLSINVCSEVQTYLFILLAYWRYKYD